MKDHMKMNIAKEGMNVFAQEHMVQDHTIQDHTIQDHTVQDRDATEIIQEAEDKSPLVASCHSASIVNRIDDQATGNKRFTDTAMSDVSHCITNMLLKYQNNNTITPCSPTTLSANSAGKIIGNGLVTASPTHGSVSAAVGRGKIPPLSVVILIRFGEFFMRNCPRKWFVKLLSRSQWKSPDGIRET